MAIDYATRVIESTTSEGGLKYELLSRENFMRYNTFMPENNKESIFVVKIMASENRIIGILSVECILMLVSKVGEKCMQVPNTWIY
ncbi:hypothetical protein NXX82_22740 [Bacteroides fragilis]|nr:hypothetical protein [Bacteroides fragilis]